ncbi:metallophosphoesterase [Oceanobacillus massiliensis]|uniref:metallophosphoesterase n=1 Tax=Oceanobacillus massiliensis TaxID=1465765 RepID=UPI0002887E2A|nr:metallophosphoesterase [Oceanobacillus massiliensis]
MNRRSFIKKTFGSLLAFIGLSGGTYYYSREIEPSLLKITEETITSVKLNPAFNQFKIIQLSDTHIGFQYSLTQFKELTDKINSLEPDLIVFTGDLVDEPNNFNWDSNIVDILQSMKAPYGKYWIYGNHDHGGYGTEVVRDVMEESGFQLLQNSHATIEKNSSHMILAGIDDVMLGKPDLESTLQNTNPDLFTILLAHEPDYADHAAGFPVDVQLSGHSHGGQVRLPFIGHLYTPAFAEKYVQGKYDLESEGLTLYVNSGIGTTRLPYRFLCRPELHMYTLHSKT